MSGKKNKVLRKIAAALAPQIKDQTYDAYIGKVYRIGDRLPTGYMASETTLLKEISKFPVNKKRLAKKYLLEKARKGAKK